MAPPVPRLPAARLDDKVITTMLCFPLSRIRYVEPTGRMAVRGLGSFLTSFLMFCIAASYYPNRRAWAVGRSGGQAFTHGNSMWNHRDEEWFQQWERDNWTYRLKDTVTAYYLFEVGEPLTFFLFLRSKWLPVNLVITVVPNGNFLFILQQ